jgi:hypothetical protein
MHNRRCAFKRGIAATFNNVPVAANSVVLLQVRTENSSKPRSSHPEPKKPDNGVQLIAFSIPLFRTKRKHCFTWRGGIPKDQARVHLKSVGRRKIALKTFLLVAGWEVGEKPGS